MLPSYNDLDNTAQGGGGGGGVGNDFTDKTVTGRREKKVEGDKDLEASRNLLDGD